MFFQPTLLKDETFNLRIVEMTPYPLHWHSDLEILCCIEGSFNMYVRKTEFPVNKNDIVLIGSCEPHEIRMCSDNVKVIEIRLGSLFCGASVFKEIMRRRFEASVLRDNHYANVDVEQIYSLFSQNRRSEDELEIRGRLYLLLTRLLRTLPATTQISDNHQKRLSVTLRIQKALDLVATHFNENITLEDAASVSGYETSAFCRVFKNATDSTFHKYLTDYRMKMSMILLEENHYSIAEISNMVGFAQQKNFSRLFKNTVGISPTEYRKKYLINK